MNNEQLETNTPILSKPEGEQHDTIPSPPPDDVILELRDAESTGQGEAHQKLA